MVGWDPGQYLRFAGERLRPAVELLARVDLDEPSSVVDLGCGTGTSTALLVDRWPGARVVGLDSSAEMLASAREEHPDVSFALGDIATWQPDQPVDVLYTNAALHWLDDHAELFARLVDQLAAGGVLAVQMPRNHRQPSHTVLSDLARSERWSGRLAELVRESPVREPNWYHDLLTPLVSALDVWETTYLHVLTGEDPVASWTKGTALRPFLDALDHDDAAAFFSGYATAVAGALSAAARRHRRLPVHSPVHRGHALNGLNGRVQLCSARFGPLRLRLGRTPTGTPAIAG